MNIDPALLPLLIDALTTHRGELIHQMQRAPSREQYLLLQAEAKRCFDTSVGFIRMRDSHTSHLVRAYL